MYFVAPGLSCSMWDLAPWAGDWTQGPLCWEHGVLGTIREVPRKISLLFNKIKADGEWAEPWILRYSRMDLSSSLKCILSGWWPFFTGISQRRQRVYSPRRSLLRNYNIENYLLMLKSWCGQGITEKTTISDYLQVQEHACHSETTRNVVKSPGHISQQRLICFTVASKGFSPGLRC